MIQNKRRLNLAIGIAVSLCSLFFCLPGSALAAPQLAPVAQGTSPVPPTIEIIKKVMPASDAGRFNLLISGNVVASNVGDGGSSGGMLVSPGTHIISERAAAGTSLADYDTTIQCENGFGQPVGSIMNGNSLGIQIASNQQIICTITNVRVNTLRLAKTDNGATAELGSMIDYELMFANPGGAALTGVLIEETVPAYTTFDAAASSSGWSCTPDATAGSSCTFSLGTVSAGASSRVPIIFAVKVDSSIVSGNVPSINNLARIVDDSGRNIAVASESTPLDINPILSASKAYSLQNDADGNGVTSAGDTLAYNIVIENNGDVPVTGIRLSDSPDPYTSLANGSIGASSGFVVLGNGDGDTSIEVDVGTLLPGGTVSINYQVMIDASIPLAVTRLENQAIVTSIELPALATDDPATLAADDPTVVFLSVEPILLASQTDSLYVDADGDGTPSPGDTLLLEVVVSNIGNGSATNLNFTETLDSNTTIVANSLSATQGTINDGADAGDTMLDVFIGTLSPNQSATVRYEVKINQPLLANVNAVQLQGVISSDQLPDILTDDLALPTAQDSTNISVSSVPALSLTKRDLLFVDADSDDLVSAEDILFFRLEIVNNGNAASARLLFEDMPPVHTSLIPGSVQTDQGSVLAGNEAGATNIQIDLGAIPGGGERVAISYQVRVNSVVPVSMLQSQAQLKSNTASNQNIILLSDDPDTAAIGDVTFTVVRAQSGSSGLYLPIIHIE